MAKNTDELIAIGFVEIGKWIIKNNKPVPDFVNSQNFFLKEKNALYAFVVDEVVKYIGKTTRNVEKRFVGYTNPGSSVRTNKKIHENILRESNNNKTVEIWVFAPTIPLQIFGYGINLPAGLEDSLILNCKPCWNGGKTESEQIEIEESNEPDEANRNSELPTDLDVSNPLCDFKIELGVTYFNTGSINPGVKASEQLGEEGEVMNVYLGSVSLDSLVPSTIDRTANRNKSVRIRGNNAKIAAWFQTHFSLGDSVNGSVINKNTILLKRP